MLKITIYRIADTVYPADERSLSLLYQMKEGKPYMAQIWMPRNLKLHNLYFALLKIFVMNTDSLDFMPTDDSSQAIEYAIDKFRKSLMMHLGLFDTIPDMNGKDVIKVPKSISFESMDEEEFKTQVFEPTVEIIARLLSVDRDTLLDMVGEYV